MKRLEIYVPSKSVDVNYLSGTGALRNFLIPGEALIRMSCIHALVNATTQAG